MPKLFMKDKISRTFLFHLGIVVALCCILYGAFFASLHWFTRHGKEIPIPNVLGMDVNAAVEQLKKMEFDVQVDSTYEPALKPYTVLKQLPDTGSTVKKSRTVFLTVNMRTPPTVSMPSLVGLSYRSAEMLLRNNKLLVGDTTYQPDIAAGAILEQRYKGRIIEGGTKIQQGSKIDLIIGNGLGNTEFDVPEVTGRTVEEALIILNQYNLQPVFRPKTEATVIADTMAATIIDQYPRATDGSATPYRIKMGDVIELYIE
jgi:beta-lactam-binding protein with PASTA domain